MYVLLLPKSFSISFARSLDISSDEMFANVHNANPTAYMFEWFMSLFSSATIAHVDLLFERVCHESQHLLVLIQQQHDPEIPQSLVAEPRTGDQLQAFYLSEVCRVAEHVYIEEFGDVVMSSE